VTGGTGHIDIPELIHTGTVTLIRTITTQVASPLTLTSRIKFNHESVRITADSGLYASRCGNIVGATGKSRQEYITLLVNRNRSRPRSIIICSTVVGSPLPFPVSVKFDEESIKNTPAVSTLVGSLRSDPGSTFGGAGKV